MQSLLRAIETFSRSRWVLPHALVRHLVRAVIFALALSAIWPLPLDSSG
jgi:hypothetical protein